MTLAFNTLYLCLKSPLRDSSLTTRKLQRSFLVVNELSLRDDAGIQYFVSLLEVTVEDSAGEALSADSDAFQHTVTPQLMDDQEVLHKTWSLCFIGNQAAHKVRMSAPQVGHQLAQVLPEKSRHSLEGTTLLLSSLFATSSGLISCTVGCIQEGQKFV